MIKTLWQCEFKRLGKEFLTKSRVWLLWSPFVICVAVVVFRRFARFALAMFTSSFLCFLFCNILLNRLGDLMLKRFLDRFRHTSDRFAVELDAARLQC